MSSYALICPYKIGQSENDNRGRMVRLKSAVRSLGLGFIEIKSKWTETDENEGISIYIDYSLLVQNITEIDALRLGKQFGQVIFMENDCAWNIKFVKDIFSKRTIVDNGKENMLSEVYEIESNKASTFSDKEKLKLLFKVTE